MKNCIKQISFIFALGILFVSGQAFAACGASVTSISATQVGVNSFLLESSYDSGTAAWIKPEIQVDDGVGFNTATSYPSPTSLVGHNLPFTQTVSIGGFTGKPWYFRTVATIGGCGNSVVVAPSPAYISFNLPVAPLPGAINVDTISYNSLTTTSVNVEGWFTTTGAGPTDVHFEYGLAQKYNNKTTVQSIAGTGNHSFNKTIDLSMFKAGDVVYVRAVAGAAQAVSSVNFTIPSTKQTVFQCNDGLDNDGDSLVDYPNDPGCTSSTDDDESPKNNVNQVILGCTDSAASNYNSLATKDDGSCIYGGGSGIIYGCMDPNANNFNSRATRSNNSCIYGGIINAPFIYGCTDFGALNYSSSANTNDGSCVYPNSYVYGCTVQTATNYNARATINDGSCIFNYLPGGGGGANQSGKPTAVTLIAKSATKTTATLAGIVYAPNTTANVYFEIFDANNVLLRSTPGQNLSVVGQSYYSFVATDLTANSIYYYRLVASNNLGTSVGDKMFVQTQKVGSTKTTTRSGPVAPIVKSATVTKTATSTLGASAVFGNGFFPTSFIGWLILLIIILFIIVIARVFFKKKND